MSRTSVLLRCLLCLCLVVNGLASAVAGVRMTEAAPDKQAVVETATTPAPMAAMAMPCHDEGLMPLDSDDTQAAVAEHGKNDCGSDCCHSSACTCDGLHSALAELTVPLMLPARLTQRETPHVSRENYAPPALAGLIRPPITLRS